MMPWTFQILNSFLNNPYKPCVLFMGHRHKTNSADPNQTPKQRCKQWTIRRAQYFKVCSLFDLIQHVNRMPADFPNFPVFKEQMWGHFSRNKCSWWWFSVAKYQHNNIMWPPEKSRTSHMTSDTPIRVNTKGYDEDAQLGSRSLDNQKKIESKNCEYFLVCEFLHLIWVLKRQHRFWLRDNNIIFKLCIPI